MPAIPPYLTEPIFEQLLALLPEGEVNNPLGTVTDLAKVARRS